MIELENLKIEIEEVEEVEVDERTPQQIQDDVLDKIAAGNSFEGRGALKTSLSLHPNEKLSFEIATGNKSCGSIIDFWKFKEPVTLMTSAELDTLSRRVYTTFKG